MDPEFRPMHGRLQRLAWLVIPLLLVAAATNYTDIAKALRGETGARETAASKAAQGPRPVTIAIPADLGAESAKVVFEVFLPRTGACRCHVEAAAYGRALGGLDPAQLRVRFRDLALPETQARMKDMGALVACAGFAINGKYRFRVPTAVPGREKTRTVDFLAADRNWTIEDIYSALSQQFEAAYGKPMPIPHDRFVTDVSADLARIMAETTPPAPATEDAKGS